FLAGVGGFATHDRGQRALGHLAALVERSARANARDQVGMLLNVRVDLGCLWVPTPRHGSLDDRVAVRCAARTDEPLPHARRRAVLLPAHAPETSPVGVFE